MLVASAASGLLGLPSLMSGDLAVSTSYSYAAMAMSVVLFYVVLHLYEWVYTYVFCRRYGCGLVDGIRVIYYPHIPTSITVVHLGHWW